MTPHARPHLLGSLLFGLALTLALPADVRADGGAHQRDVTVRCDKGRTIGHALAHRRDPVTISVIGTCDEHVVVDRDDVSLVAGEPGAGINGPDASRDTVLVTGNRFRLDGLTITGGRNAVEISGASRAVIQNCVTRGGGAGAVGGIGIRFVDGASGSVDHCDSDRGHRHLHRGASPAGAFGRFGVFAFHSRLSLPGSNTIADNFGPGVGLNAATAVIGDPGFALPTLNIIRGNSVAAPSQGITAILGSTLQIRNATVENNNGTGIGLAGRSTMRVFSTTVTGHAVNGVQLSQGSAATFEAAAPLSSLTGNAPFDLRCLDGESSFAGTLAAGATVDCTGF